MLLYNSFPSAKGVCMQISAIGPNFNGIRDAEDAIISLNDNAVRDIAYMETASRYNHKKSKRITNALFYSAPIAAGLATAVLGKGGNTRIFSKEVSGLAARAAEGLKVAGVWTAALASIDMLGFAKNKLAQNSSEVRNFDREHPFLSFAGLLAAGIGAVMLVNKGAVKLGKIKAPEYLQKFAGKANRFLNKNNTILNAKQRVLRWADKTPAALKDIAATALDWAPTALLFGGLFHSIGSTSRFNNEFAKNYNALKEEQADITQKRLAQLSVENDFLMQDPKNREDIELLHNPMSNL